MQFYIQEPFDCLRSLLLQYPPVPFSPGSPDTQHQDIPKAKTLSNMSLSSRATIGLIVGLLVPLCFIILCMFWYYLVSPRRSFSMGAPVTPSSSTRLQQLRTRQRGLEAQVASDVGVHTAHGFEGLERDRDEGLERNARAILSTKDIRDREWRRAREKCGRAVQIEVERMGAAQTAKTTG